MRMCCRAAAVLAAISCVAGCSKGSKPSSRERTRPKRETRKTADEGVGTTAPTPVQIETLLPRDTLVYACIESVDDARVAFAKTAVAKVLDEKDVRAFFEKPTERLTLIQKELERWGGFTFQNAWDVFRGRVVLAVPTISPGAKHFTLLLAAEIADAGAFERLLRGVCEARKIALPEFTALKAVGWRGARTRRDGVEMLVATSDTTCLMLYDSAGRSLVDDVLGKLRLPSERTLATDEDFVHALGRLGSERAVTFYLNARKLRADFVCDTTEGAEQLGDRLRRLGLSSIRSLSAALAVDPPGLGVRMYAHAPSPRAGLLAIPGREPITEETLALSPEKATVFSATRVRWPEVMSLVRTVASGTPSAEAVDEAVRHAKDVLRFDIEKDLIANLDEEVVVSILPLKAVGGDPRLFGTGVSLLVRVKDPKKIALPVYSLLGIVDGVLRRMWGRGMSETAYMGSRIRSVAVGFGPIVFQPAVAIAKDRLIIAGGVKGAQAMIRVIGGEARPYARSRAVRTSLDRLKGEAHSSLSCADSLESAAVGTASMGLVATLLLPAIADAHEEAMRPECASRLEKIGEACYMHSIDHDGAFPATLVGMVPDRLADAEMLSCPANPAGGGYYYFTGLRTTDPPEWILAIDVEANHRGKGANILTVDGRVKWETDIPRLNERLTIQMATMDAKKRASERLEQNPELCAKADGDEDGDGQDDGDGGDDDGDEKAEAPKEGAPVMPGGELHIEWGSFDDWVDLEALPRPWTYRRHLFPAVSSTTVDDDGILVRSYSPLGSGVSSLTVVAGIGALAGLVIPDLARMRLEANESSAVAALAAYVEAQAKFCKADRYGTGKPVYANASNGRGFADLYQLERGKKMLRLVDREFAEAADPASAHDGYYFVDITGLEDGTPYDYAVEFGLCAVPARHGRTGERTFITDASGTLYAKDTGGAPVRSFPADIALWERVK